MRPAAAGFLRAALVSLVVVAAGAPGTAIAAPPVVTIASPLPATVANNQTPNFNGLAEPAGGEVAVKIYRGSSAEGPVTQELSTLLLSGSSWSIGPAERLEVGNYTAVATQTNLTLETGISSPVTFTVATAGAAGPTVTLNPPASPLSDATPSFTGTASDTTPIVVQIHAGATAKGAVVATATAAGTGTAWTSGNAIPALPRGQYTAIATQESSVAGNPAGRSEPVTFALLPVDAPGAATRAMHPMASFTWFPALPQAGEPVSLVSTSSDAASPITGITWTLTGSGPFTARGAVLRTSFSAPGPHVVRLLVTNAYGLSSVAAETIRVVGHRAPVMQPFPVVRIAGTETASGVRIRVLKVGQMPAGARITVRCRGRRCPIKAETRAAGSSKRGVAPIEFRRFERSLRFGVTLEILVAKAGQIGKYTSFAIRRGGLPARVDTCLDPTGIRPLVCPSS